MITSRPRILASLLGSLLGFATLGGAQTKSITITANNGAPLFDAVMQIEKLSGARIFYEGTRDEFPGAYEDITEKSANPDFEKIHDMKPKRVLGPKAISLSATITVDSATGYILTPVAVEEALKAVIAAYNASSGPGAFTLEVISGIFYVKPTHMRDERGQRVPIQAVLATPVSLTLEKRTSPDALRLIAEQLMVTAGVKVRLADTLTDFVAPIPTTMSANKIADCAATFARRINGAGGGGRTPMTRRAVRF
jgi:hypothetical protein